MKRKIKVRDKDKDREKKRKKSLIIDMFFILLTIISSAFLIYTLTLLGSIEQTIRYVIIGIIVVFDLILVINLFRRNKKRKRIKKSIKRFLLLLLIILYIFLGYNIYRIISSIDSMNKKYVTTSTSLITLVDNEVDEVTEINNSKIATGNDEEDSESYILPWEIINEYNLDNDNEIVEYEDYVSMIRDLYAGEVDYIFLPTNYVSIYGELEEYETLEEDTKIIISTSRQETKEDVGLLGSSKDVSEPFTVLLLGVDSKTEGIENADSFNGDAIILVTFNPDTLTATMLSIPRDTYVPIACFSNHDENKITHAASHGTKCIINTVQNFTGIDIDYYIKLNFTGLVDLVDALGGIEVDVPYAFCEQNSKRKWGNNTIYVEEGLQTLNGEQALALARNRKVASKAKATCSSKYLQGTRNDFIRGQNQQLVVRGIINKVKNVENVTKIYNILDAISNNMDTNMSRDTILSFYNIAKDIMTTSKDEDDELITIQKLYLAGSDQNIYDERSNLVLYNYVPNAESKAAVIQAMKINLGLAEAEIETSFYYSVENLYTQNVIGKYPTTATKLYTLIPNFSKYTKSQAISWASQNGFTIIWNEVETSEYSSGTIYSQSYPASKRVDLCSSKTITLTIAISKISTQTTTQDDKIDTEISDDLVDNSNNDNDSNNDSNSSGDESNTDTNE